MNPFVNEPLLETRRPSVRGALTEAMAGLDRELPLQAPVLIGAERGDAGALRSVDPGRPGTLVTEAGSASAADAGRAVEAAQRGLASWRDRPASDRIVTLQRAAAAMREQRDRLTALIVREAGKPWIDADAEACEAIDFIEYYCLQAASIDRGADLVKVPGERNEMRWGGRGVVAVIAPWNFPFAISTGMITAGLVTGNAVVYKPAEQTPGIGHEIVRILRRAGVPDDVIGFLPGGDEPGAALVEHPGVHTIAFTGSCQVGIEINRSAAEVRPGQSHIKRVVAEMGGKNCLIVDGDADLDEVVPAVLYSAFGFAGQKCSAASRVLVHEAIADLLEERLKGAIPNLLTGQAERFGVDLGPVIDLESQRRHSSYLTRAAEDGAEIVSNREVPDEGYFCPPTVAFGPEPGSAVVREEVFAPLVTVERVPGLEAAFAEVDALPFALTAGIFTRNPDHAREAERRLPVGNLYVNRGITGAMVGRQPFGGNRLSGTGTKAGGPGYLSSFVEPRAVCENTMRQGLVV